MASDRIEQFLNKSLRMDTSNTAGLGDAYNKTSAVVRSQSTEGKPQMALFSKLRGSAGRDLNALDSGIAWSQHSVGLRTPNLSSTRASTKLDQLDSYINSRLGGSSGMTVASSLANGDESSVWNSQSEREAVGSLPTTATRSDTDTSGNYAPGSTPFSVTKTGHQVLFGQLKEEVNHLRRQLQLSENLNASLKEKLETSRDTSHVLDGQSQEVQALLDEKQKLERQLKRQALVCSRLRVRIEQSCDLLQQLLSADTSSLEEGQLQEVHTFIQQTKTMTSSLNVSLRAPEGSPDVTQRSIEIRRLGGDPEDEMPTLELEHNYQRAKEQIMQLELQLARRDQQLPTEQKLQNQLKEVQKQLSATKEERDSLQQQLTQRIQQIETLEQEKGQTKESSGHLQQELNRLRKDWLTVKDSLSNEKLKTNTTSEMATTLEKQLVSSNQQIQDLHGILAAEQKKLKMCEKDLEETKDKHRQVCQAKEGLSKRMVECQTQCDRLSGDKAALEREMIDLQKQLNTSMDQTNALRVSQAHIQADLEEIRGHRDRLADTITDKDELIAKLKGLLRENQITAEQLKLELSRLNEEFENKTGNTLKLQERLKQLQQEYQLSDSLPSVERTRRQSPSTTRAGLLQEDLSLPVEDPSERPRAMEPDGATGQNRASPEAASETQQEDVEYYKQQLQATMQLNESLKKELAIHKNLASQQFNNNNPGQYARPELQQQLCEIHMLRERLQESIDNNDRLRCLLEKRLLNLGVDADAVRAALSSEHAELRSQLEDLQECLNHRENAICDLRRQLDCAEQQIEQCRSHAADLERSNNCYKRELSYKNDLVNELQCRVAQKEEYIQKLLQDNDEKNAQIKCYQSENCRLANELQKAQQRVCELEQLNKELHCELCNLQQQVEMEGSALSSMLGCELRGLREQLESSITNNFALTQHLEEKMPQIPTKFSPGHACDQTPIRARGCPPINCNMVSGGTAPPECDANPDWQPPGGQDNALTRQGSQSGGFFPCRPCAPPCSRPAPSCPPAHRPCPLPCPPPKFSCPPCKPDPCPPGNFSSSCNDPIKPRPDPCSRPTPPAVEPCKPCETMRPNFDWSKFNPCDPCHPTSDPWESPYQKMEARVKALGPTNCQTTSRPTHCDTRKSGGGGMQPAPAPVAPPAPTQKEEE